MEKVHLSNWVSNEITGLFEALPKECQYTPQWVEGANHHNIIEVMGYKTYITRLRGVCEREDC
jgi:hypothetical protein